MREDVKDVLDVLCESTGVEGDCINCGDGIVFVEGRGELDFVTDINATNVTSIIVCIEYFEYFMWEYTGIDV